jgi:hypothetical protein
MVVDMFSRRAAAEKPPLSATRANTVNPVRRSIVGNYPAIQDNLSTITLIINS